jgi:hypothetical protein
MDDYNFKNAFLNDFVKKTLDKNLNYDNNELLGNCKSRYLDSSEKEFFKDLVDHEIICSHRAILNHRTYHSKNYKLKRDSNSYTIRFFQNNEEKFGEILEFLNINGKIFAKVNEFIISSDLNNFFPKSSGYFYSILMTKVLIRFYKLIISTSPQISFIKGSDIVCKCIVFSNDNQLILTPIIYEYEHD